MAVDNKQIATDVLELVGGAENVAVATNCMTRLRLTLKDNSKADVEKIKKVKGVLGCQFAGSQLQVIIGQNVPKVLAEFVAMSGVKQGAAVDENLDAPKEKFELKNLPNIILDYLSGSMAQLIPLLMAGGLFRTIAAVLGPTMLGVISDTDPTYTFLYTTLYEATFTFIPIYLGYAAAKKLGASPVLGMLLGGALMAPSVVSVATQEGGGIISVYGIQIAAANYQQSVLPIILSVPVLYFVEKFFKKVMPDVLSTVFTPFCTMIVTIPIAFIVLAPIGNELGNLIANALFGLADLGGIGILIVMAILGAFWQLFVVCGMHMPVILLAQVQIIAAGVTEPALFGILMRFRRTMLGMFIGGAIGAVFSGLMGVTYYLAGGASNFLVFTNYLQGGQMNTVWAIVGMAISFVIAAAVVFATGFSKEELAEMEA